MNKFHQFWTLFKFQALANPFILVFSVVLAMPFYLTHNLIHLTPDLDNLLQVQNLFMVGIIGLWALAPEMGQRTNAGAASNLGGTEFILTRAVDRPILYRARAVLLYLVVLCVPLVMVLWSTRQPDLRVTEYSPLVRAQCLALFPGSHLEPNPSGSLSPLLFLPAGNVLVGAWILAILAVTALMTQIIMLSFYPFKARTYFYYGFFFLTTLLPLAGLLHDSNHRDQLMKHLFFLFSSHQLLFWSVTLLVIILAQIWCEQRFARLEQ